MRPEVVESLSTEFEALNMLSKKYALKLEAGTSETELAADLTESSRCEGNDARAFIAIVNEIRQAHELPDETRIWAGRFARRAGVASMQKGLRVASVMLAIGMAGVGALVLWNPRGLPNDTRQILQWFVVGFGSLVVMGFLGIMATLVSWLQYRGTPWPEHAADALRASGDSAGGTSAPGSPPPTSGAA